MKLSVAISGLVLGIGLAGVLAGAAQPHSTSDGVFSDEQAKRGEDVYMSRCSQCHGEKLISKDAETPSLTGPRFKTWIGKTLADRFKLIRTTMPSTSPGSLDDKTSIDALAFILKFNGYPAGAQELTADSAVLETLVIDAPKAGD